MRCAACNVVLDAARIAAGDTHCVCGADLDLPGAPPARHDAPPAPSPATDLFSYRSAAEEAPPRRAVVELENVGVELCCPRCREALSYAFQGSYDVHECRRCFGAFVDAKALETFIDEARGAGSADVGVDRLAGPRPDVPVDRPARCPSCHEVMNRTVFGRRSGVVVDVCAKHGTWFDAGELAKVLAFAVTHAGAGKEDPIGQAQAPRRESPIVARQRVLAESVLLHEQVQEARALGRWAGHFEGRDFFLDWLSRSR